MHRPIKVLLVVGFVFVATARLHASILVNGDFESGDNGFITDYEKVTKKQPDLAAQYNVVDGVSSWATGGFGDHTTGSGLFAVFNGSTNSSDRVWAQQVNLTSGVNYTFSGWVAYLTPAAPPKFQFQVGTDVIGDFTPSSEDTWESFAFDFTASTSGSVELSLRDLTTESFGNDFGLDDLSLSASNVAVPEPSSLAIFGLIGLVGVAARSKRRLRSLS